MGKALKQIKLEVNKSLLEKYGNVKENKLNYTKLEQCKINLKSNLKVCKCERMKRLIKHDIEIIEKKQFKLLEEKRDKEEITGSFI